MNLTKKIICLSLIVILICNPVVTYAQSGTLAVSGGSIPEAGGKAVAVTFIMAVMQSLGMTIHLSQAAKDAGETAAKWVDDMVDRWVADGAPIDVVSTISSGKGSGGGGSSGDDKNKIGPNGKIYLTATALYFIQKFLNWLKSNGYISSGNVTETVNGTLFNYRVISSTVNNEGYPYGCLTLDKQPVAWVKMKAESDPADTNYYICSYRPTIFGYYNVKKGPLNLETDRFMGPSTSSGALTYGNYYYTYDYFGNADLPENVIDITALYGFGYGNNGMKAYLAMLDGFEVEDSSNESYIEGDYNQDDLNNADSKYTLIDPKFIEQLQNSLTENTNATISIAEYLKAIQESLNKKSNEEYNTENVKATDNETLTNVPVTVPEPEPYDITLPKDQDPGDITTEVSPPEGSEPATVPTETEPPSKTVPLMLFPLDDYFPFCIPFDVYHLLQKLSADPVAPSYTIGFTVYGTEVNYTISLDAFSSAMVIVRKMELLVCVVGLAIASRKIFTR